MLIYMVARVKIKKKKTINFIFGGKHKEYIRNCEKCTYNIAEGAVRAGKTVDNVYAFAHELKTTPDKIHLATGSTSANAKLNIGDANGFGLEYIFRGQCKWGKYKGNECLYIKGPDTKYKQKIVIFAGAAKEDSYKKIRGNSYGMWIATEVNLHHDNTIKEAFNRQLAAQRRKIFWDLNPDNPNASIYKNYIDLYAEKDKKGELIGGYNYQHFTIFDNLTVTEERKQAIISQYDKSSIWYQRDILGKRCVAEGLVYRTFVDNHKIFKIPRAEAKTKISRIILGVDFGGNGSGHSFVATGISRDYKEVVSLVSEWHKAEGTDPEDLADLFVDFVLRVINMYGMPEICYCDSAEQVLIEGLRKALEKAKILLILDNAWKIEVNERIRLMNRLVGQKRYYYTEDCETLENALCTAVWNPKEKTKDERLDDGTSDIDSLDAFEYTIEQEKDLLILMEAA